MALNRNWFANLRGADRAMVDRRERVLEVLDRRYLRESQHVTRFREHAERIADAHIRETLLRIAAGEAEHVHWLEEKILTLGGKPPAVAAIHSNHENAQGYLRSDLDEERRCVAEIEADKKNLQAEFPDIVALLDRIETDAANHGQEIRALLQGDADLVLWAR